MITYLDPRSEPTAAIQPYDARLAHQLGGPLVVGLLANGFPDSVPFLTAVGDAVLKRLPAGSSTRFLNKGNASTPATAAQIDVLAQEVQVAITAYGH
jgi:hypothetical protein